MEPTPPLTEKDYEMINQQLNKIQDLIPLVAKCKRCGLNTADAERYMDHLQSRLTDYKREFFPGRP